MRREPVHIWRRTANASVKLSLSPCPTVVPRGTNTRNGDLPASRCRPLRLLPAPVLGDRSSRPVIPLTGLSANHVRNLITYISRAVLLWFPIVCCLRMFHLKPAMIVHGKQGWHLKVAAYQTIVRCQACQTATWMLSEKSQTSKFAKTDPCPQCLYRNQWHTRE